MLNQYTPHIGSAELRAAVSGHFRSRYGAEFDPASEILITTSGTEAVYAALQALGFCFSEGQTRRSSVRADV